MIQLKWWTGQTAISINTEGTGTILTKSLKLINVVNTVKTEVLWFKDNIFSMVFNKRTVCQMIRPMISFEAKKTDNKMLTFLELPHNNNANTLLVYGIYYKVYCINGIFKCILKTYAIVNLNTVHIFRTRTRN